MCVHYKYIYIYVYVIKNTKTYHQKKRVLYMMESYICHYILITSLKKQRHGLKKARQAPHRLHRTWVTSSVMQQKWRSNSLCEKLPTKISAKAWRGKTRLPGVPVRTIEETMGKARKISH